MPFKDLAELDTNIPWHGCRWPCSTCARKTASSGWWHLLSARHARGQHAQLPVQRPFSPLQGQEKPKERARLRGSRLRPGQVSRLGSRALQLHLAGMDRSRKNDAAGVVPPREGVLEGAATAEAWPPRGVCDRASKSNEDLTGHLKRLPSGHDRARARRPAQSP